MKLLETMFSITPEALDAVDVCRAAHELAVPVVDPKVLRIAHVNQSVVAAPAVRVDDRFGSHTTATNGLKRGFLAVWDDLRVDAPVTLEEAEDDGLATGSATSLATHSTSADSRDSSTSTSPDESGESRSHSWASRFLILRKIMVTVLRVKPLKCSASVAVKSSAERRKSWRNFLAEIRERR